MEYLGTMRPEVHTHSAPSHWYSCIPHPWAYLPNRLCTHRPKIIPQTAPRPINTSLNTHTHTHTHTHWSHCSHYAAGSPPLPKVKVHVQNQRCYYLCLCRSQSP